MHKGQLKQNTNDIQYSQAEMRSIGRSRSLLEGENSHLYCCKTCLVKIKCRKFVYCRKVKKNCVHISQMLCNSPASCTLSGNKSVT